MSIHFVCGLWSLIAIGIFDIEYGVIYSGVFNYVLIQIIGAAAMIVWSAVPTFFFLMAFKRLSILRVGEVIELVGMDYLERD